ncbi:hypothetical protein CBA19CS11_07615 [Caballeronia novacaledonica]|uniref:hypothetical protein n=1 Tax=Caballeronia novacaledonica TaxID=1544861 RepID=UPI001EE1B70D|nr:hypothetical protein [Caballeronia novacaledonica]GJH08683.1 hypothetical protein CBA19CS11_07615 [Caballeronia novacaledonica]
MSVAHIAIENVSERVSGATATEIDGTARDALARFGMEGSGDSCLKKIVNFVKPFVSQKKAAARCCVLEPTNDRFPHVFMLRDRHDWA